MTLDEFIKNGLTNLFTEAARLTAATAESPDEAAAIPLVFFDLEMEMQRAWRAVLAKQTGDPARHPQKRGAI